AAALGAGLLGLLDEGAHDQRERARDDHGPHQHIGGQGDGRQFHVGSCSVRTLSAAQRRVWGDEPDGADTSAATADSASWMTSFSAVSKSPVRRAMTSKSKSGFRLGSVSATHTMVETAYAISEPDSTG